MKKIAIALSISIFSIILHSCATVGSPSGGKKDTTAPYVKSIYPENKTINFKSNFVAVEYSEYLDLSSIDKELVIVPKVDKYEIEKGTKSIKIKFKSALEQNTTYQIFFGKGIKDVNEGNVCKLKSLVFSTGGMVDSLKISGTTADLHSGKPISCFVGLYKKSDTLNITKHEAYYWLISDNGSFVFENLKDGNYEIFAFNDINKNRLYDKKEAIAYSSTSINPSVIKKADLKLSNQNLDTLKLISAIDNKDFYQIKFSKNLYKSKLTGNQIYKVENEKILVFKGKEDSLVCDVTVKDSLNFEISTKVSIDHKTKPAKNKNFIKVITEKTIPGKKYVLLTERKIESINYDSLSLIYDGKKIEKQNLTLNNDSIYFNIPIYKDSLSIRIKKGAFLSVFKDSSAVLNMIHKPIDESNYGIIAGKVVFDGPIVLELYKSNNMVYKTRSKEFEARYLEPGEYIIKVIKDRDNNGYWTQGDYRTKTQPEEVFINPKTLALKANWELKDVLIKVE